MKILNKWLLTIVFVFAVIVVTHAQEQTPVLYPGVYQAEDWAVKKPDDAKIIDWEDGQLGEGVDAIYSNYIQFEIYGTDVVLRWKNEDDRGKNLLWVSVLSLIDNRVRKFRIYSAPGELTETHISLSPDAQFHLINATTELDSLFDSITVLDRTYQNLAPLVGVAAIAVGMTLFVIFSALRERRQ